MNPFAISKAVIYSTVVAFIVANHSITRRHVEGKVKRKISPKLDMIGISGKQKQVAKTIKMGLNYQAHWTGEGTGTEFTDYHAHKFAGEENPSICHIPSHNMFRICVEKTFEGYFIGEAQKASKIVTCQGNNMTCRVQTSRKINSIWKTSFDSLQVPLDYKLLYALLRPNIRPGLNLAAGAIIPAGFPFDIRVEQPGKKVLMFQTIHWHIRANAKLINILDGRIYNLKQKYFNIPITTPRGVVDGVYWLERC